MAFRYQKINPQSQPLPVTLSTMGGNGVFEFNIGAGTTFNLSKSMINLSVKVNATASRYTCYSAVLSQAINRIQLINSNNEILSDIQDAYSYSTNMMLNCNNSDNCGMIYTQINPNATTLANTQAYSDLNTYYNLNKCITSVNQRTGADTQLANNITPVLYLGNSTPAIDSFNTWSSDLKFMYPKTLFSLDKNIHTKENLRIVITLNPVDLFSYLTTTTPSSTFAKTQSIPEGNAFLTTLFVNLYIVPSVEETNFTVHTIQPEIQKITVTSQQNHSVRIMLKPQKEIGFIAWSPYNSSYQSGSHMFGNSIYQSGSSIVRDSVIVSGINSYDLRLSGNPLVQATPVNCLTNEHILLNRDHYKYGFLTQGINLNSILIYGFVDYTCFDGRSIYEFDPNDTSYISTDIPLELTNDVVLDRSASKQHQFMIGYKKTIKCENGFLSVVR